MARNALREQLANIYLQSNNKKGAERLLETIVRDNPTQYPKAWYYLGALASGEKKYADAVGHFEKALLLDSTMEEAYYELALAQTDLHRTNDAIASLNRAQEKFHNTFGNEFFTGVVYTRMKNYGEAIKHYTAAEIIARVKDPKRLNREFYFQMGAACERNQNYKDAEACFEKSLKLAPNFAEALNYLGYMWAERGENLPKARELIERALELEPKNAAYLDSMGWVLFKLNQPQQALPYLLGAVASIQEPDSTVYDHLGDVYMALRQPEKARDAWKKALSIESNDSVKKKLDQLAGAS
jgi:tetratricopeptide (TPR) repeat protein